jgi:hypothetical protein
MALLIVSSVGGALCRADVLPTGGARPAIPLKHFPDRLHAFVWRNWELISLERMAEVLGTTPENVREIGLAMGLPPHVRPPAAYLQRGYITIIRRNWHLLPYEQLLTLLGWDAQKLAFTLREDDFLWIKLGSLKPACAPIRYVEPNEATEKRCAEIRETVSSHFGEALAAPSKPRFEFFTETLTDVEVVERRNRNGEESVRFLYSYAGLFGDPLLHPELDPYPDVLLRRLSESGVNGVWLHVVLSQLAPSDALGRPTDNHEVRLANLAKMAERAARYGVSIYLYMNEPRAVLASLLEDREELRGVRQGDYAVLCTSAPQVRQWITGSLRHVFESVPNLGGVFTITASENLTNCYSHNRSAAGCPRCSKRSGPDVIAEVNAAIAAGVRAGSPKAKVIVWDWGWPDGTGAGWGSPDWASRIIELLPDDVYLMCVSEWGKPIARGGVAGAVGEYSISAVGPGPRAQRHWALARQRGLKTLAKVQVNCTWELSAVPYLPVMNLVAQHCRNLSQAGVNGLMLSWTVGGYPSPNLELVRRFQQKPAPTVEQALMEVAGARYGAGVASEMMAGWARFSEAFSEFPFDGSYVYRGPSQVGPANLLYLEPTGYPSTMVGFPYDDVDGWRGIYPAEVLAGQFEKVASGWQKGLATWKETIGGIEGPRERANAHNDLVVAEAAGLHFDSVANQIRFILARNAVRSGSLPQVEADAAVATMRTKALAEMQNAERLFALTRQDPRIGFEASNHYYYLPLDLVEKVVNCEHILQGLSRRTPD